MRLIKMAVASLTMMLLSVVIPAEAQNVSIQKVYMFGFAQSFNDSTVYLTDIQTVDSAWIQNKTKFLLERENYSYQFQHYLESEGLQHMVCVTTYALTRKDIEKKYAKLKQRYTTPRKHYTIEYINENEMRFTAIKPDVDSQGMAIQTKEEKKAQKEAAKNAKKNGSKAPGDKR